MAVPCVAINSLKRWFLFLAGLRQPPLSVLWLLLLQVTLFLLAAFSLVISPHIPEMIQTQLKKKSLFYFEPEYLRNKMTPGGEAPLVDGSHRGEEEGGATVGCTSFVLTPVCLTCFNSCCQAASHWQCHFVVLLIGTSGSIRLQSSWERSSDRLLLDGTSTGGVFRNSMVFEFEQLVSYLQLTELSVWRINEKLSEISLRFERVCIYTSMHFLVTCTDLFFFNINHNKH